MRPTIWRPYKYVKSNQLKMPARSHRALLQTHKIYIRRRFCARLSVRVSDSGHPMTYGRYFLQTSMVTKYTSACQNSPHNIIHFYIILQFYIKRHFSRHPVACVRKYLLRQNCHSLHWYTHARLTCHRPLQNSIQTQIWVKTFSFFFFRVRVRVIVRVRVRVTV